MNDMSYRVAVAGSCDFSVELARCVLGDKRFDLAFCITQPMKPAGRGKKLKKTELFEFAEENGIPVCAVDTFKKKDPSAYVDAYGRKFDFTELDFVFVFSFGKIVPGKFLKATRFGWFNWHPSPLPKLRGATPLETSILEGFEKSALCVFKMVKELDAGDLLYCKEFEISEFDTYLDLRNKVKELLRNTFSSLSERFEGYVEGKLKLVPQKGEPTYCYKFSKEDTFLTFEDANCDERKVRAFYGSLYARTIYRSVLLKVLRAHAFTEEEFKRLYRFEDVSDFSKGQVVVADARRGELVVKCADGFLKLVEIQPAGKRVMDARSFLNGYRVKVGDRFGI